MQSDEWERVGSTKWRYEQQLQEDWSDEEMEVVGDGGGGNGGGDRAWWTLRGWDGGRTRSGAGGAAWTVRGGGMARGGDERPWKMRARRPG